MLSTILLAAAFVLFVLAAIGIAGGRFNFIAAGLALWMLSTLAGPLLR